MNRNCCPLSFNLSPYSLSPLPVRTPLLILLITLLTTVGAQCLGGSCDTPDARLIPDVVRLEFTTSPTDDDMLFPSPDMTDDVTPTPDMDDMVSPTPGDDTNSTDPVGEELFLDECFGNSDCADNEYCRASGSGSSIDDSEACILDVCKIKPRKCLPRLGLGAQCQGCGTGPCFLPEQCSQGLFCAGPTDATSVATCKAKGGEGASCSVVESCQDGLSCTPNDSSQDGLSCKFLKKVGEGQSCNDNLQECDDENFCGTFDTSSGSSKCNKKIAAGQPCSNNFGDEQCLRGFCALDSGGENGVCLEYGDICRSSSDCSPSDTFSQEDSSITCNFRDGPFGLCFNTTERIKILGASCDLKLDTCDQRRALVCELVNGEPICVQKGNKAEPCTPGSQLSTCASGNVCRRALTLNKKTPYGASKCLPELQVVKQGEICNFNDATICENGTSCVPGAGIALKQLDPFGRDIIYPVHYCMKTVSVGAECDLRKFDTVCQKGSFCIDGVCAISSSAPTVPVKFAGFRADCSGTPCAPGLACKNNIDGSLTKVCGVPEIVVDAGEECFQTDSGVQKCKDGLACKSANISSEASSILKCGPKPQLGERCDFGFDLICEEGLKCATPNFTAENSICVKENGGKLGASCDPSVVQCGAVASGFGPDGSPNVLLQCLPKESSFACQFEKQLFDICSAKENKACASGLTCDAKLSVCVPAAR